MMLLSRLKPIDEISRELEGTGSVLLVACNGCQESFGNAEPERLKYLKATVGEKGVSVIDTLTLDFLCEPILVKHWLGIAGAKARFDDLLVVSCGIGVQVVSKESQQPTYPACDTVSMGGRFGQAWGQETCKECGQCILPYSGGICPLAACSKGLLNGACGGSKDGRCEVFPETRECGWYLIYERLKEIGHTDLLLGVPLVKDYSRGEPPEELVLLRNQILERENEIL